MIRKALLGGGLLLAFLILAAALFTVPAWADLIVLTHTTLEDFNAGTLYHTGLTRYEDGEVQLLVVGLAGDWITDTNATGLPALARHTAVYTNNHIIVVGGFKTDASPSDKVYYTTIDPETDDLADWQQTTPLPASDYPGGGIFWHTSTIAHGRVYVIGGRDNFGNDYDTVSFAPIHSDGTLGDWQTTAPLPEPLHLAQAVTVRNRIYVIGGQPGSSGARDTVYIGEPNPGNGQITTWTPTTSFAYPTFGHMAAVDGDRIYVMGGSDPDPALDPGYVSPYAYFATVNPADGQLSSWTQLTEMGRNLFGGAGLSNNGVLFTTGGAENNKTDVSDYVGAALIGSNGSVGQWTDTSLIDPPRFYHAAVRSDRGWLYVINGSDGTDPIQSVNRGATSGVGAKYADEGTFISTVIDLATLNRVVRMEWNRTNADPTKMDVAMQYRTKRHINDNWSAWSSPLPSSPTPGTVTTTATLNAYARYFQYQVTLSTSDDTMTPSLNAVRLVYQEPIYALKVYKIADPVAGSTLFPGDEITYTLEYSNSHEGITTTHTIVADKVPQYTSYVPNSITGLGADDSDPYELHWNIGDVDPGESGQVSFRVIVSPTLLKNATILNVASIDSDQGPVRYSSEVMHTVQAMYDMSLVKAAAPPPGSIVQPGSIITYTLIYINSGSRDVSGIVLTDVLPAEVTYVDGSIWPAGKGNDTNPGQLTWSMGDVATGGQVNAGFRATVNSNVPNGITITNEFSADSDQTLPEVSAPVKHRVDVPVPSISVSKSANPPGGSLVEPGQEIVYSLHYLNNGEAKLSGLVLTDVLPDHVTYVADSISPPAQGDDSDLSTLTWHLPDLVPGAGGTASFAVTVDDVPGGLMIENQFEADSDQTEPEQSNVVKHVTKRQAPDLIITGIQAQPADPSPGTPFNLTVTVKNIGSQDADDGDFWVEVYIRPRPSVAPYGPADHLLGYCTNQACTPPLRAEYVEGLTSLDAQASFPLQFTGLALPGGGHYDVYAQADVAFDGDNPGWGRYLEANEDNNTKRIILGGGILYLPIIEKH